MLIFQLEKQKKKKRETEKRKRKKEAFSIICFEWGAGDWKTNGSLSLK